MNIMYVVINGKGEYLTNNNDWAEAIYFARLFLNELAAEYYAGVLGGKVKEVTITVEED